MIKIVLLVLFGTAVLTVWLLSSIAIFFILVHSDQFKEIKKRGPFAAYLTGAIAVAAGPIIVIWFLCLLLRGKLN